MDTETLRVLEYDKIRQLLARMTATGPGREVALALQPLAERRAVAAALAEVVEMVQLLTERGAPPVGGGRDLRTILAQLQIEGTFLQPPALLEVLSSIEAAGACRRFFGDAANAPLLSALAADLASLRDLGGELRSSIGARGEILDGASFELGTIRHDLLQLRSRIRGILEGLLQSERLAGVFQDRLVTERGGRYVVPVRADHRGQLKGFVHDESASGQTLFVEPVAVLELNNRLQALRREEQREEERILRRLSTAVRRENAALAANQAILSRLDFLAAAGRFTRQCDGVAPQLAAEPLIDLRGARHPLLLFQSDGSPREGAAVPVDLRLGEGQQALVISGPNTGGKTVALKTVGLLLLLVRSGLPIPCRPGSRVHLFEGIFADIGDEQSIEANLSTFSGHLSRVRRILAEADGEALVLLDEAGTGTDPAEGGALAMAVLDALRRRGTRVVLTTHLNLIKGYATLREGVENAAVEFDEATLAPTYRLHYGIPGASSAFAIARSLGLPEEVLKAAEGYLGADEREGLTLVEELNRLRRELAAELDEARILSGRAREERERRRRLLEELEGQKQTILDKARRRADQVVRESERKLKAVLREARELAATPRDEARLGSELTAVRDELAELRPAPQRRGKTPHEVSVGELLRITVLGTEGEVTKVLDDAAELSVGGKKLRLPLVQLEQFLPRRFARKKGRASVRGHIEREGFQPKLMLVGKRLEDALLLLERFLDDALLHGWRELEVVHGAGEGVLRRAVRDALADHREVTAFHAADIARGGDNVTIVELKGP